MHETKRINMWNRKKRAHIDIKKTEKVSDREIPRYNILVLGKSGAGKTALLNYVFGTSLPSSAGTSCTEKGIHPYSVLMGGREYDLFDTGGLEAGDVSLWREQVFDRVAEKNNSSEPQKWFHAVFYCFSANSARIEDFELRDVLVPLLKTGSPVIVVFTHAENSFNKAEKIAGMRQRLAEGLAEFMPELPHTAYPETVELVSVDSENMAGERFFRQGAGELISLLENGVRNMVFRRVPAIYSDFVMKIMEKWRDESLEFIKNTEFSFLSKSETAAKLEGRIDEDLQRIILHIYLKREALLQLVDIYVPQKEALLPSVMQSGMGSEFRCGKKNGVSGRLKGAFMYSEAGVRKKLTYKVNKIFDKFMLSLKYDIYKKE